MEFVIGEAIKKRVEEKGITFKSFAAVIGMTPRNLDRFFERKDITMRQLVKASEFLDFDFVDLYLRKSQKEQYKFVDKSDSNYGSDTARDLNITCQLTIHGTIDIIQKEFPSFLSTMQREAETRGLHLG